MEKRDLEENGVDVYDVQNGSKIRVGKHIAEKMLKKGERVIGGVKLRPFLDPKEADGYKQKIISAQKNLRKEEESLAKNHVGPDKKK